MELANFLACVVNVVFAVTAIESDMERKELHFVALAPYSSSQPHFNPAFDGGPALIPAVRLAVEQINNRTDILSEYTIKLFEGNSGCDIATETLISYVKNVYSSGKNIAGIIGPSCTAATSILAPVLENAELIQISSATSPDLVSQNYRNTFRTVSSSLVYVESFQQLIDRNGWSRVGSLFDEQRVYFKATHSKFAEKIPKDLLKFASPVFDGENEKFFPIMALQESRVRVIFAFLSASAVRNLLCLAFHSNMLFPTYQWVFIDRTLSELQIAVNLTLDGINYNCGLNDMLQALDGAILNVYDLARDDNSTAISGLSYTEYKAEYEEQYRKHLQELNLTSSTMTDYSNVFYDSVWALSLALDGASKEGLDLDNYTYGQPASTALISEHLLKVNFSGTSGLIHFDEKTKDSATCIDISQLSYNPDNEAIDEIPLGVFNGTLYLNDNGAFINATFDKRQVRVNKALGSIVMVVTLVIAFCTILLHIATIKFNEYPTIKANSPNLNHLIFSGCYLLSISVVLNSIEVTFVEFSANNYLLLNSLLCNLQNWSTSHASSLIIGTICAKIWRVYRLFRHFRSTKPGKLLTDTALILFVVILLVMDLVVCILWTTIDPWILNISESGTAAPIILVRSQCKCKLLFLWAGIFAMYKGSLAFTVVLLSILNRHINRKEFKHTKNVNILVYALVLVNGVGFPLYFILEDNINVSFVILNVVLNTTVILCHVLLFIPPLVPILKAKIKWHRRLH